MSRSAFFLFLIVTVASYAQGKKIEIDFKSPKSAMGMYDGGGIPGSAPTFIPAGDFSRSWAKSARFKTILQVADFEKTKGEIEKPIEERIEAFTKDIKIPEGCEGVYPVNKKLAYYYLDRKTGKLVIATL